MASERLRQELLQTGYGELRPLGSPAAHLRAQIVPPLPRTPELLRQPSEQRLDPRATANAVAGPSSMPLNEPINIVSENHLPEPTPPPHSALLSTPAPPDECRSTPPPLRISCKGWSVSELCGKYANFREVRRVKASALSEDLSRVLEDYEHKGEPLVVEDLHKHPRWREDMLNMEWLLKNASDKGVFALPSIRLTTESSACHRHSRSQRTQPKGPPYDLCRIRSHLARTGCVLQSRRLVE